MLLLLLLMLLLLLLLQLVTNRSGFKKSVSLSSGHWCDQWWWNNNGPNRSVVVAQLAEPLFLTPEIPSSSPTISNSSLRESFTLTGQKRQNMENEIVMAQFKILLQANYISTIWIEVNAVLFSTSLQIAYKSMWNAKSRAACICRWPLIWSMHVYYKKYHPPWPQRRHLVGNIWYIFGSNNIEAKL